MLMPNSLRSWRPILSLVLCGSVIPARNVPKMATAPSRKKRTHIRGFSAKSTKRFAAGQAPDPSRCVSYWTTFGARCLAALLFVSGVCWRPCKSSDAAHVFLALRACTKWCDEVRRAPTYGGVCDLLRRG